MPRTYCLVTRGDNGFCCGLFHDSLGLDMRPFTNEDPERTATFEAVEVLRDSGKAILVRIPELHNTDKWIPKSVIHDDSEVYKAGTTGCLIVQRWFAEKEKMVE